MTWEEKRLEENYSSLMCVYVTSKNGGAKRQDTSKPLLQLTVTFNPHPFLCFAYTVENFIIVLVKGRLLGSICVVLQMSKYTQNNN